MAGSRTALSNASEESDLGDEGLNHVTACVLALGILDVWFGRRSRDGDLEYRVRDYATIYATTFFSLSSLIPASS